MKTINIKAATASTTNHSVNIDPVTSGAGKTPLSLTGCPRYARCSAPICPLDPKWRDTTLKNIKDGVCFLQQESVKPGAQTTFANAGLTEVLTQIMRVNPAIVRKFKSIWVVLEKAKNTPSKMTFVRGN